MAIIANLIAAWECDNVNDSHTSAKTLTNNGTVTFSAGHVGNAANVVAASSQYLSRAAVTPPGPMTVAFMVKPTDNDVGIFLAQHQEAANNSWQIYQAGGALTCLIHQGTGDPSEIYVGRSGGAITASVYQSIIVTWAGGTLPGGVKLYINNVQTDTADATLGTFTGQNLTAQLLTIGAQAGVGGYEFGNDGQIDNIFWFDRVLTTDERTRLHNGGAWQTYAEIAAGALDDPVATPAISPNGGTFTVATEVTLTCATSGASIYYTTDGSTPDATDTLYTVPFTLSADATVKAIGIKAGSIDSAVASAAFTITIAATGGSGLTRLTSITDITAIT